MPIAKIVDFRGPDAAGTPHQQRAATSQAARTDILKLSGSDAPAEPTVLLPLFKLRNTGLLAEHLKRDGTLTAASAKQPVTAPTTEAAASENVARPQYRGSFSGGSLPFNADGASVTATMPRNSSNPGQQSSATSSASSRPVSREPKSRSYSVTSNNTALAYAASSLAAPAADVPVTHTTASKFSPGAQHSAPAKTTILRGTAVGAPMPTTAARGKPPANEQLLEFAMKHAKITRSVSQPGSLDDLIVADRSSNSQTTIAANAVEAAVAVVRTRESVASGGNSAVADHSVANKTEERQVVPLSRTNSTQNVKAATMVKSASAHSLGRSSSLLRQALSNSRSSVNLKAINDGGDHEPPLDLGKKEDNSVDKEKRDTTTDSSIVVVGEDSAKGTQPALATTKEAPQLLPELQAIAIKSPSVSARPSVTSSIVAPDQTAHVDAAKSVSASPQSIRSSAIATPLARRVTPVRATPHSILSAELDAESVSSSNGKSPSFDDSDSLILGALNRDSKSSAASVDDVSGNKRKTKGSMIVVALQSYTPQAGSNELAVEQDDILLIVDSSKPDSWKARHQTTGMTGMVKPSMVQKLDTFFAEVVAMTDYEDDDLTASNGSQLRSSSPRARPLSRGDAPATETSKSDGGKKARLSEISKSSRFNMSLASDLSVGSSARRSRTPTLDDTWTKRVGDELLSMIDKEEQKRQEGIHEYVETERAFVEDMGMVVEHFLKPLRESHVITEAEVSEIFSNLVEITGICSALANELSTLQVQSNGLVPALGHVLLKYIPEFKQFAPFCSNLSHAVSLIHAKKSLNAEFAIKLQECSRNPYFGNMDLASFLLKPMQRITKIPLLIKGILKHTAIDNPDFTDLANAESMSQETLLYINKKCGEADERRRLEKVQKVLDVDLAGDLGVDFLNAKRRRILHGGKMECSDKKVNVFLFEDCILVTQLKTINKAEKYILFRPLISLWLAEIGRAATAPSETSKPTTPSSKKALPLSLKRPRQGQKDPSRVVSINDPHSEQLVDLISSSPKDCDIWHQVLNEAQEQLLNSAPFALQRLKPLPISLVQNRRKPVTIDYKWAVSLDKYILFSNEEGILATTNDDSSVFQECPSFKNIKIGPIAIEPHSDQLLIIEGKTQSMEAYPLEGIRTQLRDMFDPEYVGSPPGLKLTKITGAKNVDLFQTGMLHDTLHLMTASQKALTLYQYNGVSKFFKKINEYNVPDAANCKSITFLKKQVVVGIGSKFFLLETKNGDLKEIADGGMALGADIVSVDCIWLGDSRILLCYNTMGILINLGADMRELTEQTTEKYFSWQSSALKFAFNAPYLKVFCKNFIEIYEVTTGRLCFFSNASLIKALDPTQGFLSISETENGEILSVLSQTESDL